MLRFRKGSQGDIILTVSVGYILLNIQTRLNVCVALEAVLSPTCILDTTDTVTKIVTKL